VSLQLDGAQLIFQTMCKVDMTSLQFVAGRMRNRVMDSEPCFAHFNSFNAYSMQTKNLDTGVCSDVRDVFCELREQSLVSDAGVVAVRYDVPYYMVYGGKILVNLPQVAGDDAGYKG
jgi:hypothetical protein